MTLNNTFPTQSGLRKLDMHQDLPAVADLIDMCFSEQMDEDGREYVRQIRRLARDIRLLGWNGNLPDLNAYPFNGFVWWEDGRIVGNLTLIPYRKEGKPVYLIANVAVNPAYRRRGIGRELTRRGLAAAEERHALAAWLQVREDNPAAAHLYRSLGFLERSRRSTWSAMGGAAPDPYSPAGLTITGRRGEDWPVQHAWLYQNYPPDVAWNMPFRTERLRPGFWRGLLHYLNSEEQRHWAARRKADLLGVLSWEPTRLSSDLLWLAAGMETEDLAAAVLLPQARRALNPRRALMLNYPAGRAVEAIRSAGFSLVNTLVWMEAPFLHPSGTSLRI